MTLAHDHGIVGSLCFEANQKLELWRTVWTLTEVMGSYSNSIKEPSKDARGLRGILSHYMISRQLCKEEILAVYVKSNVPKSTKINTFT